MPGGAKTDRRAAAPLNERLDTTGGLPFPVHDEENANGIGSLTHLSDIDLHGLHLLREPWANDADGQREAGLVRLHHDGTAQLGTSCNCGKENDVMGMLANWIHQITMPLRDLRWRFHRLKGELLVKLLGPKRIKDGLVGDVRQLARSAGLGQKPSQLPKQLPPKYPPKR